MMKKHIAALLACLTLSVLLFSGCSGRNNDTAASDALAQALMDAAKQGQQSASPAPAETAEQQSGHTAPSPSVETAPASNAILSDAEWAMKLAGWWVYMGDDRDVSNPKLLFFTSTGEVYLEYEAYYEAMQQDPDAGYTLHNQWKAEGDHAVYTNIDVAATMQPIEYTLTLSDDALKMTLYDPSDGETLLFESSRSADAAEFLFGSEYGFLVTSDLPLVNIRKSELAPDENGYYIDVNYVTWVSVNDTELIETLGLENAYFDDDYELYEDERVYSLLVSNDSAPEILLADWESGNPALEVKSVDAEEFRLFIEERGDDPLLASILCRDGSVSLVREMYVP